jgi:Protein of unknown function (DUF1428)
MQDPDIGLCFRLPTPREERYLLPEALPPNRRFGKWPDNSLRFRLPSKKARDEAWSKLMADPRMQPNKDNMPFDGKRMIYGGFATILDA